MPELIGYEYEIEEKAIVYADELESFLNQHQDKVISYDHYVDDYEPVDEPEEEGE